MKKCINVEIRIPEEFISHYKKDKFENSLQRVLYDIKFSEELLSGIYEKETIEMLLESLKGSIIVGENDEIMKQEDILYMEYMRGFNKGKASISKESEEKK